MAEASIDSTLFLPQSLDELAACVVMLDLILKHTNLDKAS